MSAVDELYPMPCAFCRISSAYPHEPPSNVPVSPDPERVDPQCHLILSTPLVLAFLDIMPISPGHILLTTRKHYRTLGDLRPVSKSDDTWTARRAAEEARDASRALGEWLPIVSRALCKVTGIEDWNVVQNNGERAAQVVPHIHFHLIPRYQEGRQETQRNGRTDWGTLKSWKMFGRGSREDLDDDEAKVLAKKLRDAIREEVEDTDKAKL
ncbi:Putative histidine triad (HIT) protein [Septoria linicola]|uniref:Histidine triad (HIT) protein n=1 Tax=Septoria linicola TaxID=215465 RepID=A0A9Q9ADP7_9PEZI|nr:putative histidine triad (HIT) protein [Septoria linicola]USW47629.1 Putative histidine triad (HIT) protein [Septoria linicola]